MKEKELERLLNLKKEEKALYEKGIVSICGIDEAGRGPLAGPVVVECSLMPKDSMIEGVNDSKKIAEKKRERIYEEIIKEAIAYGVGIINQEEIDRINILNATKKGLTIAIKELEEKLEKQNLKRPEVILVDALTGIDTLGIPYKSIIHGDAISYSIACASIIAKVTRDRMMYELDKKYPMYDFKNNKGYPTKKHLEAINKYGIIKEHRKSYGPVAEYLKNNNKNT